MRRKGLSDLRDFTGPESYVHKCIERGDVEFFPLDVAMSLEATVANTEAQAQLKVNELAIQVSNVEKMQQYSMMRLQEKLTETLDLLRQQQHLAVFIWIGAVY